MYKNKKNKANRIFALFCATVALWSYPYIGWPLASTANEALFWFQFLHIGACFTSVAYFHFVVNWLNLYKQKKIIVYFGYFLATFFSFFIFSSYFISGIEPKFSMNFWAKPGILYHFYLFYFFGYSIYSSYLLYSRFKVSAGVRRQQIKYILVGMALSFIGGSTNYFLWYNINIPPYGNIFASSYVILGAYAIVRHRLLDIKIVLRKSSVYLTSLSTILIFAVSAQYVFYRFFVKISVWADFIILILSISFFPLMNKYYYRLANKYFFTSLYDTQTVIMKLSDKLRATMDLKKIYKFISDAFIRSFHTKAVGVLLYNEKAGSYMLEYNKGFSFGKKKKFVFLKQLKKMCESQSDSIIIEELRHSSYKQYKEIINKLDNFKIEVLSPLNIKGKNIGFIALGAKESRDIYNNEDLQVLRIASAQVAIVMENAILYEETKKFNVKLKKEIKQATAELRSANAKLKKLDTAKSDFISIASHQLRTPLTVIKGYISMLIEGAFGKLNDKESDSLKKVYESNERLIKLVENLLNISRVESGRLKFDFKKEQLEKVAASVMEELSSSAKKKGLMLNYEKPDKPLPKVKIDETKIRQVILNLIDNSIKYTQKGLVNVSLKHVGSDVRFCVSDTGMGISAEDLPKLFKRFSRGKDVSLINANGSGLGLYVSKIMAEAHKGKIWCESEGKGKGAKFCFTIPIFSHNA
ncbi:hypothetical protein KAU19_06210 [Candidatus Parcubacteria bacterium]|nr:hypothetical protein [Candidatus Parcubacteria bacterium]